jgi:hypothetical protein
MSTPSVLLAVIPPGLRDPLIEEYNSVIQNYMERRWSPAELSGGKFCEIVYTILDGYYSGTYAAAPSKPRDFVAACRALESKTGGPRSFQILIPRLLPALYEIRNNRGVGHAGGDVNPNPMDASAVVSMTSWILAELVRVFHNTTASEAQIAVDNIIESRMPMIWSNGDVRRVLRTGLKLKDQIMLLLAAASTPTADQLFQWTEYGNRSHFNRILRELHASRLIEYTQTTGDVLLLPPGANYVADLLQALG